MTLVHALILSRKLRYQSASGRQAAAVNLVAIKSLTSGM